MEGRQHIAKAFNCRIIDVFGKRIITWFTFHDTQFVYRDIEKEYTMKKILPVMILLCAILAVVYAPVISAYPGGIGSSDQAYCGEGCHNVMSTAAIEMHASDTDLLPGDIVTVTVNVSGGEADGTPLGVMLIVSLSPAESLPSAKGWTIISDPSGSTALNYYEVPSFTSQISLTWTLETPSAEGIYTLYARVMHGNGGAYAKNSVTGIAFIVGTQGNQTVPSVIINSPADGEKILGVITIAASIISTETIQYAILKVDDVVRGNLTSAPFVWELDTNTLEDGTHTINITAIDSNGGIGHKQITIDVWNKEKAAIMTNWVATIFAGTIAIVSIVGILVVVVLLLRKKIIEGKVR